MKWILALILTTFSLFAKADETCVPYFECRPLVVQAVKGPLATHLFWFVRNESTGGIDHHGFSCRNDYCDSGLMFRLLSGVLSEFYTPARVWELHMSFNCDYSNFNPIPGEHPICAERKLALVIHLKDWLEDYL